MQMIDLIWNNLNRPGKMYPFTNRFTKGLFTKTLNLLLGLSRLDRSDRSTRLVRPVGLGVPHLAVNMGLVRPGVAGLLTGIECSRVRDSA